MGIIQDEYGRIEKAFARMATVQINTKGLVSYLARVFPGSAGPQDDGAPEQAQHKRTELERFFEAGCGTDLFGVRGTLWGAYNAVTEYVDHYSRKWKSPDGRLKSVCFGSGYQLKVRAFAVAQDILSGKLN